MSNLTFEFESNNDAKLTPNAKDDEYAKMLEESTYKNFYELPNNSFKNTSNHLFFKPLEEDSDDIKYFSTPNKQPENTFNTCDVSPCCNSNELGYACDSDNVENRNMSKLETLNKSYSTSFNWNNFVWDLAPTAQRQMAYSTNTESSKGCLQIKSSTEENKETIIVSKLDELFKTKTSEKKFDPKLAVRRDVLNKNILRIMSRYFKSIHSSYFPKFKKSIKDSRLLLEHLETFISDKLGFHQQSDTLIYAIGGFTMAPKMKIVKLSGDAAKTVSIIQKCLSKYTHQDMDVLCSNSDFKTIFTYFLENGMEFMNKEPVVQASREHYMDALNEISMQQQQEEHVHDLDLDFINQL